MACTRCGLNSRGTLCEVCCYLTEEEPQKLVPVCDYCGIPIFTPAPEVRLCQICRELLIVAGTREWFTRAHVEWEQENVALARIKQNLMSE